MSLNSIELNRLHLTQLYQKVLLEPLENKPAPETQNVKYLGKNAGNILILVKEENYPYLSDKNLQFLTAILTACKLSLGDVAIVNGLKMSAKEIHSSMDLLKSKSIIAFGIEPSEMGLPMHFPAFQLQHYESRHFIHSPDLDALEKHKELKMQLWISLKNMFNI
jgi:hypothetical protein